MSIDGDMTQTRLLSEILKNTFVFEYKTPSILFDVRKNLILYLNTNATTSAT